MKDKKLFLLTFFVLFLLLVHFSTAAEYYCEERNMVAECDSFSSYYSLANGKCINTIDGNKLCSSGWSQENSIVSNSPKDGLAYYVDMVREQGAVTVIVALFFYIMYLVISTGHKYLIALIDKKLKRRNFDLMKHPVHSRIDYWLKFKITHLQIQSDFRREVISDFLQVKLSTWKIHLLSLSQLNNINKLSIEELEIKILEDLDRAITEYNKKCENQGIPKMFIEKFNEWHMDKVEDTYKRITQICQSSFYINNKHKIGAVLDKYMDALNATIIDAERTLQDVNGEMKGQKYKGLTCKK